MAKVGEFTLRISTLNAAFCNSSGLRDSDCEAFELADILRRIANAIEGERDLMEDRVVDSDGNECGRWMRR